MFNTSIAAANHITQRWILHWLNIVVVCCDRWNVKWKCNSKNNLLWTVTIVHKISRKYTLNTLHLSKSWKRTPQIQGFRKVPAYFNVFWTYGTFISILYLHQNYIIKSFLVLERNKTGSLHFEKWVRRGHFYVSIWTLILLHTVILKDLQ